MFDTGDCLTHRLEAEKTFIVHNKAKEIVSLAWFRKIIQYTHTHTHTHTQKKTSMVSMAGEVRSKL